MTCFPLAPQLLQPAVSVVGVEDSVANKQLEEEQPQHQHQHQRQQQQQRRIKSKSIFIEQVREHVERGQQMSWQDVRDEANVIIAAVSSVYNTYEGNYRDDMHGIDVSWGMSISRIALKRTT